MGSGCIQIWSKNTTVKREWIENNDNAWGVTSEEWCGQIVRKEERGRQRSNQCGTFL